MLTQKLEDLQILLTDMSHDFGTATKNLRMLYKPCIYSSIGPFSHYDLKR